MKKNYYALFCALAGVAVLGVASAASPGNVAFTAKAADSAGAPGESSGTAPEYDGKKEFSATVGQDVSITLTASGDKPVIFEAEDLPADLTLDLKSGVISGKVSKAGDYSFTVVIKNKAGSAKVSITLKVK